jgi:hypothetical protein
VNAVVAVVVGLSVSEGHAAAGLTEQVPVRRLGVLRVAEGVEDALLGDLRCDLSAGGVVVRHCQAVRLVVGGDLVLEEQAGENGRVGVPG